MVEEELTQEVRKSGQVGRQKARGYRDKEVKRGVCSEWLSLHLCKIFLKGQIK